jgi:hypothetical protein
VEEFSTVVSYSFELQTPKCAITSLQWYESGMLCQPTGKESHYCGSATGLANKNSTGNVPIKCDCLSSVI